MMAWERMDRTHTEFLADRERCFAHTRADAREVVAVARPDGWPQQPWEHDRGNWDAATQTRRWYWCASNSIGNALNDFPLASRALIVWALNLLEVCVSPPFDLKAAKADAERLWEEAHASCKWFEPYGPTSGGGWCHRFRPPAAAGNSPLGAPIRAEWPFVRAEDRCGEWKDGR
jgi:hypothetical protein